MLNVIAIKAIQSQYGIIEVSFKFRMAGGEIAVRQMNQAEIRYFGYHKVLVLFDKNIRRTDVSM